MQVTWPPPSLFTAVINRTPWSFFSNALAFALQRGKGPPAHTPLCELHANTGPEREVAGAFALNLLWLHSAYLLHPLIFHEARQKWGKRFRFARARAWRAKTTGTSTAVSAPGAEDLGRSEWVEGCCFIFVMTWPTALQTWSNVW